MSGKLTTHILDTARGCPGKGIIIELWAISENSNLEQKTLLKMVTTNQDGRTDEPLLGDGKLKTGVYELVFRVGKYFADLGENLPSPAFLDYIPLRFGIADANSHYHVPLLVSPWSYSTYRGS
ncbi:MAG TPA: hydroxyisourate hydrolase [Xenococcaceae cyanobacterium]